MARTRLDGLSNLTPADKAERDARQQYGLNVMRQRRVWVAAIVGQAISAGVPGWQARKAVRQAGYRV
jgi:hypothetical protein